MNLDRESIADWFSSHSRSKVTTATRCSWEKSARDTVTRPRFARSRFEARAWPRDKSRGGERHACMHACKKERKKKKKKKKKEMLSSTLLFGWSWCVAEKRASEQANGRRYRAERGQWPRARCNGAVCNREPRGATGEREAVWEATWSKREKKRAKRGHATHTHTHRACSRRLPSDPRAEPWSADRVWVDAASRRGDR